MPATMLHQNEEKSKQEKEGQQRFMGAMKTLGIAALLWQNNIRKESRKHGSEKDGSRRSAYELFKTLLLLVFQGENLYRFLSSDKGETACSKNSYYRFLEDCHANWNRFVMVLAVRVITYFSGNGTQFFGFFFVYLLLFNQVSLILMVDFRFVCRR